MGLLKVVMHVMTRNSHISICLIQDYAIRNGDTYIIYTFIGAPYMYKRLYQLKTNT